MGAERLSLGHHSVCFCCCSWVELGGMLSNWGSFRKWQNPYKPERQWQCSLLPRFFALCCPKVQSIQYKASIDFQTDFRFNGWNDEVRFSVIRGRLHSSCHLWEVRQKRAKRVAHHIYSCIEIHHYTSIAGRWNVLLSAMLFAAVGTANPCLTMTDMGDSTAQHVVLTTHIGTAALKSYHTVHCDKPRR